MAALLESELPKPDVTDAAFLREVDEEYRRSQLAGLWSRYGRIALVGLVLLLVAVAGLLYWRAERARQAGLAGEQLMQALAKADAGDTAGAAPILAELARSPQPGYRALAELAQAASATQGGNSARALALYHTISADAGLASPFRDLATIKATRLEFDTLAPAVVVSRLQALAIPGNPWFPVAAEMTAIAQLRAGKPALAGPLFAAIARDAEAPPSLRGRAAQLAASLGAAPADRAAPAAAPPPVAAAAAPAAKNASGLAK